MREPGSGLQILELGTDRPGGAQLFSKGLASLLRLVCVLAWC